MPYLRAHPGAAVKGRQHAKQNTTPDPNSSTEATRPCGSHVHRDDGGRVYASPDATADVAAPTQTTASYHIPGDRPRSPLGVRWDVLADVLEAAADRPHLRERERFALNLLAVAVRVAPRRALALGLPEPTDIVTALLDQAGYRRKGAKQKPQWPWRQQ